MAEHIPGRLGPREGAASLAPKTNGSETQASGMPMPGTFMSKARVSKIADGMSPRLVVIQKLRESIKQIEQRPVSFSPPPRDTGRAHPVCAPSQKGVFHHRNEEGWGSPRLLRDGAYAPPQNENEVENGTTNSNRMLRSGPGGDPGPRLEAWPPHQPVAKTQSKSQNIGRHQRASPVSTPLSWRLGVPEIDQALPWAGLKPSGVHEIKPAHYRDTPVARVFALALIVRYLANGPRAPLLCCLTERSVREFGFFYGPGLLSLGLDPELLILVRAAKTQDLFWAMEEGLKAGTLSAVLADVDTIPFTAARRLALAAESRATPCLILSNQKAPGIGPALTRWKISAEQSASHPFDPQAPGTPRWRITLERCRHGPSGLSWNVEWSYDTHRFCLAASLADRTIETDRQGQPGVARPSRTTSGK